VNSDLGWRRGLFGMAPAWPHGCIACTGGRGHRFSRRPRVQREVNAADETRCSEGMDACQRGWPEHRRKETSIHTPGVAS
jgi:hypothetical protein